MRFSLQTAVASLFAAVALAAPCKAKGGRGGHGSHGGGRCLQADSIPSLVSTYQALVGNISSLSDEEINGALHPEFVDWSNSISAFFGAPYSAPAFATRDAFVAAQKRANQVPIAVEGEPIVACDKIVLLWTTATPFPATDQSARGIAVLSYDRDHEVEVENDMPAPWKLARVDVEFNSLAWAAGVGGGYRVFNQQLGDLGCDA